MITDKSNQRSVFALIYEQRKTRAAINKALKAKQDAKSNAWKKMITRDPEKRAIMEMADEDAVIFAAMARKPMVPTNRMDAGIRTYMSHETPNQFTCYLPPDVEPGMPLEVVNEFGDKCVTVVPKEEAITTTVKERPKKHTVPVVGYTYTSKKKKETVVRKTADFTMGYGVDGIVFIVNDEPSVARTIVEKSDLGSTPVTESTELLAGAAVTEIEGKGTNTGSGDAGAVVEGIKSVARSRTGTLTAGVDTARRIAESMLPPADPTIFE